MPGIKAERRLRLVSRSQQHANDVPLRGRQAQRIALTEDKRAFRIQHAQGPGHLRTHFNLAPACKNTEKQLHLPFKHTGYAVCLFPHTDAEGLLPEQIHQPGNKALRQGQVFGVQPGLQKPAFQMADIGSILQKPDDLLIHA